MQCVRTELPQTKLNALTSTSVLWAFRRKYVSRIQSINSTQNQYCIFKTKALNSVLLLNISFFNSLDQQARFEAISRLETEVGMKDDVKGN